MGQSPYFVARNANGDIVPLLVDADGALRIVSEAAPDQQYETVAASQTAQALGPTGAEGDYLTGVLVIPATTSPGVVTVLDGVTSVIAFPGGATSVPNLVPFFIPLGAPSKTGAWHVTTGANVSVVGVGRFT